MVPPAADAPLVLVVEDELSIAAVLRGYLERDGLRCLCCADGVDALAKFDRLRPDLVLLDIQLPGMDGLDVLRNIRALTDAGVILLTAFVDDIDRLLGLRLGADDYVTKPFVPAEVIARVRAVLRRTLASVASQRSPSAPKAPPLRHGALTVDVDEHVAAIACDDGRQVELTLTLTEFRLLACLAAQPRRVHTRDQLIEQCLPESDATDRVVDSHLSKLRRKLSAVGQLDLIEAVRGVGYRLASNT